jgi:hypothetical protein
MTTSIMTPRGAAFSLIGSGIVCLAMAAVGEAAGSAPRAFVSTTGSDANPCSAAQPCRSFNQALTVVEPGGEIVVQDSGGYSTAFTITQSVTIDASGFNASVISTSATDLCTINAGASDRVVLRGISFHGANLGASAINVAQVGSLYVEHCTITEFSGFGSAGIAMLNGGNLFVTDTDLRKCFFGLVVGTFGATAFNLVAHDSRFTEGFHGIDFLSAGTGAATGTLINCTAALCSGNGFTAAGQTSSGGTVDLTLINCRAIGCGDTGIRAQSQGVTTTVRMANCVVTQNSTGVFAFGGAVIGTSPGTNLISGNGADGVPGSSATLH